MTNESDKQDQVVVYEGDGATGLTGALAASGAGLVVDVAAQAGGKVVGGAHHKLLGPVRSAEE